MPTESPKTMSFRRSNVRSPAGNLPFGEIGTAKLNSQMVYTPELVQSHGQRLDTQRPEGGSKREEEVAVPGHNVGEVNSTATDDTGIKRA
ncbi:uncharacterized protein FFB14_12192 [Fusarium fujikuroi]|nr:uncharacterized protein FFB14_12192 [Fusarium fujikuroi]